MVRPAYGRRSLVILACLAVIVSLLLGPAVSAGALTAQTAQRWIVVLKASANPGQTVHLLELLHGFEAAHVYGNALQGFAARLPSWLVAALARDPRVAFIEPDLEVHIAAELRTGVDRVDADLHPLFAQGSQVDVDIAVLDTGIDPRHPDLNVAGGVSYVPGVASYADDHGHGTHVAGIAAARYNGSGVAGVAPGARVWAVKILNSGGSGYMSGIIKGVDWVTARASTIEVANMSLGAVGRSDALRAAIQRSVAAGVVYVAAAGNSGRDVYGADGRFGTSDDFIPAAYPEVAAVSALADSDGAAGGRGYSTGSGPDDTMATFSNYSRSAVSGNPVRSSGAAIDVAAPGVGIYSTWLSGGYRTASGTSMASPHAAGVIALYMAHNKLKPSGSSGVYAVRQAVIDAGQSQNQWRQDGNTRDPDGNREPLAYAGRPDSAGPVPQPEPPPPPAPSPGVSVSPSSQTGRAFAGSSASYAVTVKNTGNVAASFVAGASSSWPSSVSPETFWLAAGASAGFVVTHSVPAAAAPGSDDTGRLTVSAGDARASVAYTTTARGYSFTVSPQNRSGEAAPGLAATYEYTVKNTGTETDTYPASVSAGWTSAVSPGSLSLGPGQSGTLTVRHEVPALATGGSGSGALRVASSGGAPAVTAAFSTTVKAAAGGLNVGIRVSWNPRPGGFVPVTVTVTGEAGNPVPSAQVSVQLRTAAGRTYSATRTTNRYGNASVWFWTWSSDYFPWRISAQAVRNGAAGSGSIVYPSP